MMDLEKACDALLVAMIENVLEQKKEIDRREAIAAKKAAAPACQIRFELSSSGVPFASTQDPRKLVDDPDFPPGDYDIVGWCSCVDRSKAKAAGTLRTYGDGIGVLRDEKGLVYVPGLGKKGGA
jgi:hypothetical protein